MKSLQANRVDLATVAGENVVHKLKDWRTIRLSTKYTWLAQT
jgi:hypothetical protein